MSETNRQEADLFPRHSKVIVTGEDFEPYEATVVASVWKLNGKVRYVVEDRGRLFIQRPKQLSTDTSAPAAETSDHELGSIIASIERHARRMGCIFVVDPDKLASFPPEAGPRPLVSEGAADAEHLVTLAGDNPAVQDAFDAYRTQQAILGARLAKEAATAIRRRAPRDRGRDELHQ